MQYDDKVLRNIIPLLSDMWSMSVSKHILNKAREKGPN